MHHPHKLITIIFENSSCFFNKKEFAFPNNDTKKIRVDVNISRSVFRFWVIIIILMKKEEVSLLSKNSYK